MAIDKEGCEDCEGKKEIPINKCFIRDISNYEIEKFLSLRSRYKSGSLPCSGGELDQPYRLMLYFRIFDDYIGAWRRLWPEE